MATFGYCRVSTAKQAAEGESLDVQRRQIEGYALMQGLTLDGVVVEEGVSGSIPVHERPKGGPLFAGLKKGDVVIAPKLDRLFRSDSYEEILATLAADPSEFAAKTLAGLKGKSPQACKVSLRLLAENYGENSPDYEAAAKGNRLDPDFDPPAV